MVSILDQYEIESGRVNDPNSSLNDFQSQFAFAYVQSALSSNDNSQIFEKQKLDLDSRVNIKQVEICNDILVVLNEQKTLRRVNLENLQSDLIDSPERISKFFLDPSGKHLLISTENYELYYYLRASKKCKQISKLKGYMVTSVGWNSYSTEFTTESILIGTQKGILFEICINISDEGRFFNQSLDNYCKQVYSIGRDTIVTGIQICRTISDSLADTDVYDIIISTPKRLYEFIGNVNRISSDTFKFSTIFNNYDRTDSRNEPIEIANFTEMPGSMNNSQLKMIYGTNKNPIVGWMTGSGMLICELDYNTLSSLSTMLNNTQYNPHDVKRLITESSSKIISYPHDKDRDFHLDEQLPLSFAMTQYHVLIMFEKTIKIVCILSEELILNEKQANFGKLLGFWQNTARSDIGFYTDRMIVKYKIVKETRNLWRLYLKKNEFDLAKEFCKDNPIILNEVRTRQAEHLFTNKKYIESAEVYALTENSFEEICLKFLEVNHMTALRTFLTKKFQTLKSQTEITQITVIVAWIIEIYSNQLAELNELKNYDEYALLHNEFYRFLDNNKIKECLVESKEAIYEIFSGHGNMDDLVYFAELMKDYEKIINYYIHEENYRKALDALLKQDKAEFYYKYSPILMQHVCKELVQLWIQLGNKLDAKKLLPSLALSRQDMEQGNEALRYLEFCVYKLNTRETAIHNYLISLYVKYQPKKLLEYIKQQAQDESKVCYDKYYALRLCLKNEDNLVKESCVYIYKLIGLYEEAVDLALQIDVDLAKEIADSNDSSVINDEMKHKLWLRIARHTIEEKKDVSKAMSLIEECGGVIQIEDVLPYFPDFVTIDEFKDAIGESLASYTRTIDSLKEDIEQAAVSAESIRTDIQAIRAKSVCINSTDRCQICQYPLLTRSFYVFPCAHKFHSDCMYHSLIPFLLPAKRKKIEELQKLLRDVSNSNFSAQHSTTQQMSSSSQQNQPLATATALVGSMADALNQKLFSSNKSKVVVSQAGTYSNEEIERLKSELDELLASECVYCGEAIIKTIDEPFFRFEDYENIFKSWL